MTPTLTQEAKDALIEALELLKKKAMDNEEMDGSNSGVTEGIIHSIYTVKQFPVKKLEASLNQK